MGRLLRVALAIAALVTLAACTAPPAADPAAGADRATARLATGVSLDRFVEIIGRKPEITRAAGAYEEALWIDDAWAVQAVVGPYAEVQAYSVTTRSDRFHPRIAGLDGIALGATALDTVAGFDTPAPLVDGIGVTNHGAWWYSEGLPASGATAERAIVLTASDGSQVGVTAETPNTAEVLTNGLGDPATGPFRAVPAGRDAAARHAIVPTTYSVVGPTLTVERLPADFRFGPSAEDVLAVFPAG